MPDVAYIILIAILVVYIVHLRRLVSLGVLMEELEEQVEHVMAQKAATDAEFEERFKRMTEASLTYQLGLVVHQGITRVKNLEKFTTARKDYGHHYKTHFPVPDEGDWQVMVERYREPAE